ncbi:transglutaminase family protein [Paraburkholderia sp. Ac-20336]|uniref:transglutaminase family protein n=1 Tax=Burkholderiaceae TaxID=119060 RepID=UPI0014210B85|nr:MULTISPECIES: transglutaminase family protein [Burkholderiaceae]MBN3802108.1 transglutaminase family protein [Paraburkholderia sp. Ac-20336]MBN3845377.1 transglutaminase family protein [Paraburkholderia sp. Ac-20342]NIF54216.1 transglutaminase family protein [Burkholderia sp. Ax-1724]NIF76537.1 transglutaminase family protein [Paraburkholderia sp. Cy-641]
MYLTIRHDTSYRYEATVHYSIQQLRLTPASGASQTVRRWSIDAPGKLDAALDAYGNVLHTLVINKPHSEIHLRVTGEVETVPLADGVLRDPPGPIPLEHFTCATRLTEADAAIRELAATVPGLASPAGLIALSGQIVERVKYRAGITEVSSTAAEALALGNGVCQDHAHLMLACCRARGVPARYVSGYIEPGDVPHSASHAWVDVWLDGTGWVSIDVTHAAFASERYCRLAVARDYEAAAPVRGRRIGGLEEKLDVSVTVSAQMAQ